MPTALYAMLLSIAAAQDQPLFLQETVAVAAQPGGLLSDTVVEHRAPILRLGGLVFNDTYAGAGGRYSISPAFTDVAVRASFAPIDVFDITVQGVHTWYFNNAYGLQTFDALSNTTGRHRQDLFDNGAGFGGRAWSLIASPTGKMKVGPVVALSSWNLAWVRFVKPPGATEPWVFEPFRGMLSGWNDLLVDYTQALLYQAEPGDGLVRFGAVLRGKWAVKSPDATLTAGGLMQVDPGGSATVPSVVAIVTPYLRDPDYAGQPIPFVALLAQWER